MVRRVRDCWKVVTDDSVGNRLYRAREVEVSPEEDWVRITFDIGEDVHA